MYQTHQWWTFFSATKFAMLSCPETTLTRSRHQITPCTAIKCESVFSKLKTIWRHASKTFLSLVNDNSASEIFYLIWVKGQGRAVFKAFLQPDILALGPTNKSTFFVSNVSTAYAAQDQLGHALVVAAAAYRLVCFVRIVMMKIWRPLFTLRASAWS